MSDAAPTLGVGFEIETGGSFASVRQLEAQLDATEAKVVGSAGRMERATAGAVNFAPAIAQMTSFGNAASRELQTVARSNSQIEATGEALVRQLDRQNAAFGKTRSELRSMKVEQAAAAAEQRGMTDLAARLRAREAELYDQEFAAARRAAQAAEDAAQEKVVAADRAAAAVEKEAQALRSAAHAHELFEARVRRGAAAMREQEANDRAASAAKADLEARTRRMVNAIDPAAAAQDRFNREMAEARTLVSAGTLTLDQYVTKLGQEKAALAAGAAGLQGIAKSAVANRMAMQGASYQVQDFLTQVSMGANPINAFAVQGAQLAGQFSSIEGKAGAVARFFMGPWGLAITGVLLGVGMLSKGLFGASEAAKAKEKAAKDLASEMAALEKATRSATMSEHANREATLASAAAARQKALDARAATIEQLQLTRATLAANLAQAGRMDGRGDGGTGAAAGSAALAANNVRQLRELDAQLALREDELKKKEVSFREAQVPILRQEVAEATDAAAAATGRFERSMDALNRRFGEGRLSRADYLREATRLTNANEAAQEAIQAAEKAETAAGRAAAAEGRRQERLGRSADAVEAQIENLYRVSDAYRVSGDAALLAEARLKAESDAIRQRADIEGSVNRQAQVLIAQRVSDAARSTAGLREQAEVQARVNSQVTAGLVPAERAAELVRDQIADLPLLAAIQVAQQRGLAEEAAKATQALEDQRAVREQARAAEQTTAFNGTMSSGAARIAELETELDLIGASDMARARALTTIRATAEAERLTNNPDERAAYVEQQIAIAEGQLLLTQRQNEFNQSLTFTAELFDTIDQAAVDAANGMRDAFGSVGGALGEALTVLTGYHATEERLQLARAERIRQAGGDERAVLRENRLYAIRSASLQVGAFGDMASAARGFFKEGSRGWKAMETAEKAARAVEFALSVRAIAQDAIETGRKLASSAARTASKAAEAVVNAIASLPFPANLAAGAATAAAIAALGVSIVGSIGGGGRKLEPANEGRGTVFGDPEAQSESIRRSIDGLREIDTLSLSVSRNMLASLRSIDGQIGGVAALVVRSGNVDASIGVREGFRPNAIGSVLGAIPLVGGLLSSLFGSKTTVTAAGLYGGPQTVGSIVSGGFDARTFSDVQKERRFLGIKTGTSSSTQFGSADPALEQQFSLIVRSFSDAVTAASGPLGLQADDVAARVNGMTIALGKIDLKGLTGEQIQEKLSAVFGSAADRMASGAVPGIERFQRVGEGAFETLVRVASTVEAVSATLDQLGGAARSLGIDAKLGLVDQFDSVGDFNSAAEAYFERFFSVEEQAAARARQMEGVFAGLGVSTPATLAGFRALVEAQDLNTEAGRRAYATLLQLAPAFADLQSSMEGAKSAADILAERQSLERRLLELAGDAAAIRELELSKVDQSNRALQLQVWAIEDAQAAARAADELRKAWSDVNRSIEEEIRRIRGLTDPAGAGSFASLQGQFNAQSALARAGDQDAAKLLPGLSQSLLKAAEERASSRQELDRIRAQTATSLELTLAATQRQAGSATPEASTERLLAAMAIAPGSAAATPKAANDAAPSDIRALIEAVVAMREDNNRGHAETAGAAKRVDQRLERVTEASQGAAIAITTEAA